jgi:hypothetical protein
MQYAAKRRLTTLPATSPRASLRLKNAWYVLLCHADGHTPKQQALLDHQSRGGKGVQPKVISFLTMVEHYMGNAVPVRVASGGGGSGPGAAAGGRQKDL